MLAAMTVSPLSGYSVHVVYGRGSIGRLPAGDDIPRGRPNFDNAL